MSNIEYEVSLVIACYNESSVLEESVRQIVETLDNTCWTYEIAFVDDCSQDNTRDIIEKLIDKYRDRRILKLFHKSNMGRGRTVADGFGMTCGNVVGYIDIDLEVHARYIPSLVIAVKNGADLVTAHRIYKIHPRIFHRFVLSKGYSWLVRTLLGIWVRDTEAGFKFFKRESLFSVLDHIEDNGWFWDTEVVVRSLLKGYEVCEIPCLFIKRYDKKSTVNLVRDTRDYFIKLWRFRKVVKQMQDNRSIVV
jgi:glycosyltransferase involved in cell wall biosynthesis